MATEARLRLMMLWRRRGRMSWRQSLWYTSLLVAPLLGLSLASPDSPPWPVPIVTSRDPVPAKREPPPPSSSPTSSWAPWPQFPTFGQAWPNSLLGFPPLFSVSTPSIQREEERQKSGGTESTGNSTPTTEGPQQFVGIRARFNPPTFEEIARLFYSVFNHEAQHIQIRPQKQCFAEGCFRLHTFRITGFQRPRALTLKPLAPNLLLLNILSFDVDIESLLNGNIQLLLTTVPITGNFQANTRQLSITALFDLQKDQNKVPYLRMASCELRSGSVSTKVSNLGLLTDSINLKYKAEMLEKARELITATICETISETIKERVNQVLRRLPRAISVATIFSAISPNPSDCPSASTTARPPSSLSFHFDAPPQRFFSNQLTLTYGRDLQQQQPRGGPSWGRFWRRRQRRGMEVIEEEAEERGKGNVAEITGETSQIEKKKAEKNDAGGNGEEGKEVRLREPIGKKKGGGANHNSSCGASGLLVNFLDMNSLGQVFIELDFLDSSAGSDFFAVGLSGDVFLRIPHQVSYVGGGVHEVLVGCREKMRFNETSTNLCSESWERSTNGSRGEEGKANGKEEDKEEEEREEEDKSLLGDIEEEKGRRQPLREEGEEEGMRGRQIPPIIRFPSPGPDTFRKSMEIIFTDLTANLVLLQAHRAKLLKVKIGAQSKLFGSMLKTSCGPDEVCLGDSVPEAGEKYPEEQLEMEVEPVQPPRVKFSKELASLSMIGAATFFLARNRQPIARIPFTALIELAIRPAWPEGADGNETASGRNERQRNNDLEVALSIPKLDILEDVDFFELPASMLEGFREAARGAIVNSAAQALAQGIPLDALERKLCPWGITQPGIRILKDGLVLLSAELDAYTLLFEDAIAGQQQIDFGVGQTNRPRCPPPTA